MIDDDTVEVAKHETSEYLIPDTIYMLPPHRLVRIEYYIGRMISHASPFERSVDGYNVKI